MVVQLHNGAQHALPELRDAPSASVGYFGDQSPNVQSFEQSADAGRLPASESRILVIVAQVASDVLVAKSVEQVVTCQHGLKQPHIMVRSRIETSIASLSDYFSLGEPF